MWIQDKFNKKSINLDHVISIEPARWSGEGNRPIHAIKFYSKDMTHYQSWEYPVPEQRDNMLEHIKWKLSIDALDATQVPLKLE
jgi:hypothetical protein